MEPLAKPNGITLADHTRHVRDEAARILAARPFLAVKYGIQTGNNLLTLADACARWHDAGKQHLRWQQACRLDFEAYQRTGRVAGLHLRKAKVRHEFDSLVRLRKAPDAAWLPPEAEVAIAAHHGKLGTRYQDRWKDDPTFSPFKQRLWKLSGSVRPDIGVGESLYVTFERAIKWRYRYGGLRAVLRLADRRLAPAKNTLTKTRRPCQYWGLFATSFLRDGIGEVCSNLFRNYGMSRWLCCEHLPGREKPMRRCCGHSGR
ncbi:hypothetical protein [Hymenobacter sp. BRD67]|uniref:hypothetical protein n=1 Tax=Hymenobacter sp. BRD67 TaxID=2675877 RepID=UPI0015665C82|nr:hypothetical protein [Hymenobacter sp. BRD67]QKG55107.1 hypothetical protein GKZ67_22050 [Hymenobacter sp. BRD67]